LRLFFFPHPPTALPFSFPPNCLPPLLHKTGTHTPDARERSPSPPRKLCGPLGHLTLSGGDAQCARGIPSYPHTSSRNRRRFGSLGPLSETKGNKTRSTLSPTGGTRPVDSPGHPGQSPIIGGFSDLHPFVKSQRPLPKTICPLG